MSTTRIAPPAAAPLPAALAAALAAVADHHETARLERQLDRAETAARQTVLERAAQELDHAAIKQIVGAGVSAGFQLIAARASMLGSAAQVQLNQALAKSGDMVSAASGFDQAAKLRLDRQAEALQAAAQDAARARGNAEDAGRRLLGDAGELVRLMRDAAQAARPA